MKKFNKFMAPAALIAACLLASFDGISQNRKLPDGTIVYGDGTRKLPNGTVIYKGGTIGEKGKTVNLPDGSVVLPDGTRKYPQKYPGTSKQKDKHGKSLPPGQAKKVYGGSAKDYAPGQVKKVHEHSKHAAKKSKKH